MGKRSGLRVALVAVTLFAGACVGGIVGGGERPGGGRPGPGAPSGGPLDPGMPGPGGDPRGIGGANAGGTGGAGPAATPPGPSRPKAPLRRLSRSQYNNTVRDLLGDATRPADAFLVEEVPGSFAGSVALAQASPTLIEQYRSAAERLAASAVKNLGTLLPCQPQPATEETCARAFIDDFGLRALRRPLIAEESAGLLELFRKVRVEGDFAFGVQAVIAALLQAPSFLYRVELPPAGAAAGSVVPLGPYEISSRLSYFLLGTMPDRDLFAAAKAGKLATPADLEAQARRLLKDPRARDAANEFFGQWLSLANLDGQVKDAKLFPEFSETLRKAMREETTRFTSWALFDGDGKVDTLLTSPRSMVNAPLGKLYDVTAGADFALVDLPAGQRSGLLTHASLLTLTAHSDSTSPTRRGKFVLDQIMCQSPPPPPPNVDFKLPPPKPGQTARERFAAHTANPTCAACHLLIDPVGFGFESYSAIGKFQATDGGKPVDASGDIRGSVDLDGPFVGVVALGRKLVASAQVRRCLVQQWFSYAQGRPDEAGDAASVAAALELFAGSGSNVRELMVALVKTDAFRSRLVEVP
jgi:hypothetical protein